MPIYHLTLSVRGRHPVVTTEAERRIVLRGLTATAARRLLLFSLVDDHLHALLRTRRPGRAAEGIRRALLARHPHLEFKRPHLEPVASRAYLRYLVTYLLLQPDRHKLAVPSALWSGSGFQDLLRARILPGFDPTLLAGALPRLRMRELFSSLGLGLEPLTPTPDETLAAIGPARLVALAAGVFAVGPKLVGRGQPTTQARALASQLGVRLGMPANTLASLLGVTPRAVRKLAGRSADLAAERALRRRLALEQRVAERSRLRIPSRRASG